jgi:sigma-B regulation protein RsbU (phosphoserine phosphatase)
MGSKAIFESTITEEEFCLETGSALILYTDGVTEAHPKDAEEFGYENLLAVVERHGTQTALGLRDAIIEAVVAHMQHESPEDDLTLVVVKWKK